MQRKDYKRLAKISLESRKSTTKSTVRGISFGLILLIPVLFVALALYSDLNTQANKSPEHLFAQLNTPTSRSPQKGYAAIDDRDSYNIVYDYKETDKILSSKKVSEAFVYEQVQYVFDNKNITLDDNISNETIFEFSVGSSSDLTPVFRSSNNQGGNPNYYDQPASSFAAIIDMEKSDGVFSKKIDKLFNGAYLEGMDKGFSDGGKGQVILSELFLKSIGLEAEDVYNKTFSLKHSSERGSITHDNDNDPNNNSYEEIQNFREGSLSAFLCHEYVVVGIVKSEVTEYAQKTLKGSYQSTGHLAGNYMFFTTDSLIMPDGNAIEPLVQKIEQTNSESQQSGYYNLATYTLSSAEIETLNQEYIALGVNIFTTVKGGSDYGRSNYYSKQTIFLEAENFNQLEDQIKLLTATLSSYSENAGQYFNLTNNVASRLYSELSNMYGIFSYVILILSILGGIVFFAAMVNLFNSIVHSVDSRRNYLGVMRAIGAKSSTIPKMYFAESISIFRRALIWVIIFSTLICVGIKLILDSVFSFINSQGILPMNLGINIVYIPISIAIGVVVLMIIGLIFSYGCSRKISKKPITEVLSAS